MKADDLTKKIDLNMSNFNPKKGFQKVLMIGGCCNLREIHRTISHALKLPMLRFVAVRAIRDVRCGVICSFEVVSFSEFKHESQPQSIPSPKPDYISLEKKEAASRSNCGREQW